jgi:hypothetical protein
MVILRNSSDASFVCRDKPDTYLPVAHTCFFSIDIPRYSSKEVFKDRLLYAIYNCNAIDGDDTTTGRR